MTENNKKNDNKKNDTWDFSRTDVTENISEPTSPNQVIGELNGSPVTNADLYPHGQIARLKSGAFVRLI